ncbi:hypothetical protein BGX26_009150, partial [Mortierella sp. AD094]
MEVDSPQIKARLAKRRRHTHKNSRSPFATTSIDIRKALETYYKPELSIRRISGDPLDLDSCYVNLAIFEAPYQRQRDKEELEAQAKAAAFHRMPSCEEISKPNMKAPIPLEKLFDKRKLRDGRND